MLANNPRTHGRFANQPGGRIATALSGAAIAGVGATEEPDVLAANGPPNGVLRGQCGRHRLTYRELWIRAGGNTSGGRAVGDRGQGEVDCVVRHVSHRTARTGHHVMEMTVAGAVDHDTLPHSIPLPGERG